ncbi:MAG: hypothetical protein V3V99_11250 [candidate division Zixibacteria bacterium]
MKEIIPFVLSHKDCAFVNSHFPKISIAKVGLNKASNFIPKLPSGTNIWIDAGIDCLVKGMPSDSGYLKYLRGFTHVENIAEIDFQKRPKRDIINEFVVSVLNETNKIQASWTSVPQLPIAFKHSVLRINALLATSTGEWILNNETNSHFILPVILEHENQTRYSVQRTRILNHINKCYRLSNAKGVWVVDCDLKDFSGSDTMGNRRLPNLIKFHRDLRKLLGAESIIISGPYWGANILLLARGLSSHSAIKMGVLPQYFLPGQIPYGLKSQAKIRIALQPLKRLAVASPSLQKWLIEITKGEIRHQGAQKELLNILKKFNSYADNPNNAKRQIVDFYKDWIESILGVPDSGRALALYQSLSEAYVLGKEIKKHLPRDEQPGASPEKVAQQLMLNCL